MEILGIVILMFLVWRMIEWAMDEDHAKDYKTVVDTLGRIYETTNDDDTRGLAYEALKKIGAIK
jgi:hypothetical protein